MAGQTQDLNIEAGVSTGAVKFEYYAEPFSHTTPPKLKPGTMICCDCQCMVIGSYGDKYSDYIKDAVVPKLSYKPNGEFLGGVSDDLELVQDMIRKDPHKQLAYVLPDVPGAQRSVDHYLAQIEEFLTECSSSGGKYIRAKALCVLKVYNYSTFYSSLAIYSRYIMCKIIWLFIN